MSKVYTVDELAKEWHVSDRTVRRLIQNDKLDSLKIGKVYRISNEKKEEYERKKPPLVD